MLEKVKLTNLLTPQKLKLCLKYGQRYDKIFISKIHKRKSYIAGITKLINSITKLIDQKGSFSDFSKFDKSLESHIQNIRDLTTKIIGSESDDKLFNLN